MLNLATTVQTQIQTKQPVSNGNDFTHPNKSEDKQFDNILAREVAEKESSHSSKDTTHKKNDTVSIPKSDFARINTFLQISGQYTCYS